MWHAQRQYISQLEILKKRVLKNKEPKAICLYIYIYIQTVVYYIPPPLFGVCVCLELLMHGRYRERDTLYDRYLNICPGLFPFFFFLLLLLVGRYGGIWGKADGVCPFFVLMEPHKKQKTKTKTISFLDLVFFSSFLLRCVTSSQSNCRY